MRYLAAGFDEWLMLSFFLLGIIVLLMGIVAFGIAWGGRRLGMLIGVLSLAVGLYGLVVLLLAAPHLWWISVIPVAMGAATLRSWYHHTGPASARPLRFDLRGLFALILFIGMILGGITSQVPQTRFEEEVAAKIEALPGGGGNNFVDWRFGRVNGANFLTPLSPADFERIADVLERLSQLRVLQLNGATLPGRVTQRIGRLTTLRSLLLQNTPVSDADLRPLENLRDLECLDLDASQLTDAGLVHLRGLKRLRLLHLYDANKITPKAMTNLRAGLPRLDHP
jgi:hypothetical protein